MTEGRTSVVSRLTNAVGRVVDRVVSIWSPQLALTRVACRNRLSAYDAAEYSRKTRNRKAPRAKPDVIDLNEIDTLQNRSRAAGRNNPYINSAIGSYSRNVVGIGILATSAVLASTPGGAAFNKTCDDLFFDWSTDASLVDSEQVKNFYDIQEQVLETLIEAGEAFVLKSYAPGRRPGMGLCLRVMEPESLATTYIRNPDNSNEIRHGIEVDRNGAPVAYWFYTNPNIYVLNFVPERIPADRVLHIFKQRRPGQSHGIPRVTPVLRKADDLKEYDEYQLQAAKIEAAIALIVTRGNGAVGGVPTVNASPGDATQDAAGNRYADIDSGLIFDAIPGDSVSALKPERPGGTYEPFMKQNLRAVAAGSGLSYETVARDFTQGTYSSLRQSLLEDRREYRMLQVRVIRQLCIPVRNEFIRLALLEGALVAPGYTTNPKRWQYAKWHTQGWEWIDPKAEAEANKTSIEMGFTTREKVAAEKGDDYLEIMDQRQRESEQAAERKMLLPEEKEVRDGHFQVIEHLSRDPDTAAQIANQVDFGQLVEDVRIPRRHGTPQQDVPMPSSTPPHPPHPVPPAAPVAPKSPPPPTPKPPPAPPQ